MYVGGVEAASREEADRHTYAGADQTRECPAVGADSFAAFTHYFGAGGRFSEREFEVFVVGDEGDAVFGCRGEEEVFD